MLPYIPSWCFCLSIVFAVVILFRISIFVFVLSILCKYWQQFKMISIFNLICCITNLVAPILDQYCQDFQPRIPGTFDGDKLKFGENKRCFFTCSTAVQNVYYCWTGYHLWDITGYVNCIYQINNGSF